MSDPVWRDLLTASFENGARGPDKFDCFGLAREMLRRSGEDVSDVESPSAQALMHAMIESRLHEWEPTECKPGVLALIRIGKYVSHVAYVMEDGWMIHCWEGSKTVVRERLADWEKRIVGYYKYKGKA